MATTITVPSGSGGASVTLTFATAASSALATSLLSAVYSAAGSSNLFVGSGTTAASTAPGVVNEYLVTNATSSVTVPAGYNIVVDAATGPVTISGNSDISESIVASNGGFLFFAGTGTGSIVAGGGSATIASSATTGGGFAALGDATYTDFLSIGTVGGGGTVGLLGNSQVTLSGSNATVFGASGTALIVNSGGANTIVAGTGATTIDANTAGGLSYNQSAPLTFVATASTTLVTGGPSTITGGPGASTYFAFGTSAFNYTNGGGNDTIGLLGTGPALITNGAGGNLTLLSSPGLPTTTIVGGSGAETVDGVFLSANASIVSGSGADLAIAGNAGSDTLSAGAGSDTFISSESGAGADTFLFKGGSTPATSSITDTIFNFSSLDTLALSGYSGGAAAELAAINAQVQGGGGVRIVLPDNTQVQLTGITHLSASQTSLT